MTAAPFLKWAGGKRQLLPELLKHVPPTFGRYFEPFLGGGALFFELSNQKRLVDDATLGDGNLFLAHTYETVRDHYSRLVVALDRHAAAHAKHGKEHYIAVRAEIPRADRADRGVELAARLIYLNRTCFNGLYRTNKAGTACT